MTTDEIKTEVARFRLRCAHLQLDVDALYEAILRNPPNDGRLGPSGALHLAASMLMTVGSKLREFQG